MRPQGGHRAGRLARGEREAPGELGQRLVALGHADPALSVVAAIDRADHPHAQKDAGELAGIGPIGVPLTPDLRPTPAALIDFSAPASMRHWLKTCRDRQIAMVVGTTGLHDSDHAAIDQAAERGIRSPAVVVVGDVVRLSPYAPAELAVSALGVSEELSASLAAEHTSRKALPQ